MAGTVGASAAGAALGLTGTLSATALANEATAEDEGAGASPIPPIDPPAAWDDEADIVIVGMGGGGLVGACVAADAGASVIAIERLPYTGGNSQHAGGFFTCGGTRYTDAVEFAVPSYPYDPDAVVQFANSIYQYEMDIPLLKTLAVKGPECVDYMGDIGVDWEVDVREAEGGEGLGPSVHVWRGATASGNYCLAMKPTFDAVYDYAAGKGVQFMLSTEAQALVYDGGRVVGIKVEDEGRTERFIHAKKAVILTAGGFANNMDMLKKYQPSAYEGCAMSVVFGEMGECIRMGLGVGADVAGFNSICAFDGGLDWRAEGGAWEQYLYDGCTQVARQPWLTIDRTGARVPYVNSKPATGLGDLATAQMIRPGKRVYIAFDSHYSEYFEEFGQDACRKPIEPTFANIDRVPEAYRNWEDGFQRALDGNVFKKADTIEELEGLLGLREGVLVEAVRHWNENCEAGVDDFPVYPMSPERLKPIVDPPFYGACMGALLFATKCGLLVNTKMQVIDTDGAVIPGLYASFHTAGGGVGENCYNGNPFLGSILADVGLSCTGGLIAAENAVLEEDV